jgi:hypothetical protein
MNENDAAKAFTEMLPLEEWRASDFRAAWTAWAEKNGEASAWELIYALWQIRAGEREGNGQ